MSACVTDCGRGAPAAGAGADGIASDSDSGMMSSTTTEKITSVCCQPNWSISATANGENRNWPKEPAAVPAPKASVRHCRRHQLAEGADHDGEGGAGEPEAEHRPGGEM